MQLNLKTRSAERLDLGTKEAKEQKATHLQHGATIYDLSFKAVGISDDGLSVTTFLEVRVVKNKARTTNYCYIHLYRGAGEPMIQSQHIDSYESTAIAGAFNKLFHDVHDVYDSKEYVAEVARLFRPDLRACRIV